MIKHTLKLEMKEKLIFVLLMVISISLLENKRKIIEKHKKLFKEISFNRQTNNFMPCRDNKIFIFEGDKKEYCKIKD